MSGNADKRRSPSRAKQRAALEREAAGVRVPPQADVCVVGGGAAGLAASIVAAERGARVVVLERELACGRTILATGNGRCNFANTHLDPSRYNEPGFVAATCGDRWLDDVLGFLEACGLAWEEEAEGRLYPVSRQAASVRNVLLLRARRAGVTLAAGREVTHVEPRDGRVAVAWQDRFGASGEHELVAKRAILSVGGHRDGTGSLTSPLSHAAPVPVLCPLGCTGPALHALDGRRVRAMARLLRAGGLVAQEQGEVLFRTYGLSGIAVFDLSRHALPADKVVLDLLPSVTAKRARRLGALTLDGLLDPQVAQALLDVAGNQPGVIALAKRLEYEVVGPAQASKAQVMRGGLLVGQFDPVTLASASTPGILACGEALDVDGPCGGFNLAWAWKSGMVAGAAAAREALT